MLRILTFLLIVFALGLGFAWLAERPGDMIVTFGGYQYRVTVMVAAVAVTAMVAGLLLTWWILRALWNSPYTIARYFRVRRRDRGYQALSTGMIAAGAGDAALARKMNKQAAKLIRSDQEPLIMLLDAQSSLLEGDHETARQKFEAMLDDPEMRVLGLRGLYLEAERLGDRQAARHYAGRAADIAPQLAWAADSTLEQKTAIGDWDAALKLVDARKPSKQAEREAAQRRRAVLLTAKANAIFDTDPAGARAAALEANRLAPAFAPAALVAARTLFRNDEIRKGTKILEAAWKAEPHPEIADLYVHARHGDATHDRLMRARRLQSIKQNHAESALAVARAALDAGEYAEAREAVSAAIRMQPREAAWLLLADIEDAETGDEGRVRQHLAKALRAPRDPAWVADGVVAENWAPVSPVTGRLDAFEWRVPVERLGQVIEADEPEPPRLAVKAPEPEPDDEPETIEAEVAEPPPAVVTAKQDAPAAPSPPPEPTPEPAPVPVQAEVKPVASVDPPAVAQTTIAATPEPAPTAASPEPAARPKPRLAETGAATLPPPPDDPGVDPAESEPRRRRFRLF